MLLPDYACAIIRVPSSLLDAGTPLFTPLPTPTPSSDATYYLLEQRGSEALSAANMLTCFGGRREADESALACIHRELSEELQWQPTTLRKVCMLWVGGRYIADFFACDLNVPVSSLQFETGRSGRVFNADTLNTATLSPWHRAVFTALIASQNLVELPA